MHKMGQATLKHLIPFILSYFINFLSNTNNQRGLLDNDSELDVLESLESMGVLHSKYQLSYF